MESQELRDLIDSFIGGSDGRYRHPLNRSFIYTEGVRAVATAAGGGAYWLLDILATEVTPLHQKRWTESQDYMLVVTLVVDDNKRAHIEASPDSGIPPVWSRELGYTNFPVGLWKFYLLIDCVLEPGTDLSVLILPTEY